jgi:hypothetical protein
VTILGGGKSEGKKGTKEAKRTTRTIETIETIETTKITSLLKQCTVSMRAEPLSLKCAHATTLKQNNKGVYVCVGN